MPCASVSAKRTRTEAEKSNPSTGHTLSEREFELRVVGAARDPDPHAPERPGRIAKSAVEQRACELADPIAVVDPHLERARTRPDGEVGVPELRRDGASRLLAVPQVGSEFLGHPTELGVKPLGVGDIARKRFLARDR